MNDLYYTWWATDGDRMPVVNLRRVARTVWGYFVTNIHGGGSGSSVDSGSPQWRAWAVAVGPAPKGTRYRLTVMHENGRIEDRGVFIRGEEPWATRD